MPFTDTLSVDPTGDARRVLRLCNACQFCDGYCAVFQALKRRRAVSEADATFLSNLCHNCRTCYHACQYAPPHGFAVNLPKSLSFVRHRSYRLHVRPAGLGRMFRRNGRRVLTITMLMVAVVTLAIPELGPTEPLLDRQIGPNAFYRIVPWPVMAGAAGLTAVWAVLVVGLSARAVWRAMGPAPKAPVLPSLIEALRDAVTLHNLGGGGAGCNDRDERFSTARRRFHHALVGGMALCFASTGVATVYDHALGWPAPYPLMSAPVLLGSAGGLLVMLGTAGLAALKWRADPAPVAESLQGADWALLMQLFLVASSGLALLTLRGTTVMGPLLLVHLGLVLGLFLTAPCSKLLHAPFRFAALLRAAMERRESNGPRVIRPPPSPP